MGLGQCLEQAFPMSTCDGQDRQCQNAKFRNGFSIGGQLAQTLIIT
jgi:hypothetical protein